MGQALPKYEEPDDDEKKDVLPELTIEGVATKIKNGDIKNIVVMTGAGVSVSAGIPDFRTPGTGLYDNLQQYKLPRPEAMFDINFFSENPKPFFVLAKEMYPGKFKPTRSHFFIKLLEKKGILLRCYTQNVDTLERVAGIQGESLVEAHGSFAKAKCLRCKRMYDQNFVKQEIFESVLPRCKAERYLPRPESPTASEAEVDADAVADAENENENENEGPRNTAAEDDGDDAESETAQAIADITAQLKDPKPDPMHCGGIVKPEITFFGEALPDRFVELRKEDMPKTDLLIVMGTSLKVQPFCSLIDWVAPLCPRLLINRELVGVDSTFSSPFQFDSEDNYRDVVRTGDCDSVVMDLAIALDWQKELQELMDEYDERQSDDAVDDLTATLDATTLSKH
eukprot:GFYU01003442.1.p1 GENE.GFYU01003442.1~~GFYU01003442.1.p1  ORF type:complete len:397 (+),score=108.48 GFYU01003442.1:17-1207(+)